MEQIRYKPFGHTKEAQEYFKSNRFDTQKDFLCDVLSGFRDKVIGIDIDNTQMGEVSLMGESSDIYFLARPFAKQLIQVIKRMGGQALAYSVLPEAEKLEVLQSVLEIPIENTESNYSCIEGSSTDALLLSKLFHPPEKDDPNDLSGISILRRELSQFIGFPIQNLNKELQQRLHGIITLGRVKYPSKQGLDFLIDDEGDLYKIAAYILGEVEEAMRIIPVSKFGIRSPQDLRSYHYDTGLLVAAHRMSRSNAAAIA